MADFWKFAAVALLSIGGTLTAQNVFETQSSAPCPADCECSEESEAAGPRGWRAEAKAINKRIDSLEARFIPGVRPGSIGDAPK